MGQQYPKYSLEDALLIANAVYKQNKQCKVVTAAAALNSQPSSSTFVQKKASAKWFGLINEDKQVLTSTPLTTNIISPYNDDEKLEGLRTAFNKSELFQEVLEHIPFDIPLTKERIATIAERECKIQVDNKDNFVEVFIKSATYCNLLKKVDEITFLREQHGNDHESKDQSPLQNGAGQRLPDKVESFSRPVGEDLHKSNSAASILNLTININFSIDSSTSSVQLSELFNQISLLR